MNAQDKKRIEAVTEKLGFTTGELIEHLHVLAKTSDRLGAAPGTLLAALHRLTNDNRLMFSPSITGQPVIKLHDEVTGLARRMVLTFMYPAELELVQSVRAAQEAVSYRDTMMNADLNK